MRRESDVPKVLTYPNRECLRFKSTLNMCSESRSSSSSFNILNAIEDSEAQFVYLSIINCLNRHALAQFNLAYETVKM